MRKIKNILNVLALSGTIAFYGCDKTNTAQQKDLVCKIYPDGENMRVMAIKNNKFFLDEKQEKVKAKIEDLVNGGKYNVVSVKTFYSKEHLTSALVTYNIDKNYNGPGLRVIFISSDKDYWDQKEKEVKPKLHSIVNSGEYDIKDIKTIFLSGYLVSAEVYYHNLDSTNRTDKL